MGPPCALSCARFRRGGHWCACDDHGNRRLVRNAAKTVMESAAGAIWAGVDRPVRIDGGRNLAGLEYRRGRAGAAYRFFVQRTTDAQRAVVRAVFRSSPTGHGFRGDPDSLGGAPRHSVPLLADQESGSVVVDALCSVGDLRGGVERHDLVAESIAASAFTGPNSPSSGHRSIQKRDHGEHEGGG